MSEHRPWVMEVWETDPDTLEDDWVKWSTTKGSDGAVRIRDRLLAKGRRARVRNSDSGEILGDAMKCPHCDTVHAAPFDGSCIL